MDKVGKYTFNLIAVIFILVSLIHIVYATITNRGLYEDGAFYAVSVLNNLADGQYNLIWDSQHPRFIPLAIMQIPLWIMNIIGINEKKTLLTAFSFIQFFIPLLILFWNYRLTKRTGKIPVLFFHLFMFCTVILPFSVFSVVESIIGFGTAFVLWNYLASDIKFTKTDIAGIIFCTVFLFGSYEYNAFIGALFFLFHFSYILRKEGEFKEKTIKMLIGISALAAAIFNVAFMLGVDGEESEISRFIGEAVNWLPHIFNLCSLYSVIAFVLILIFAFKKTKLNLYEIIIMVCIFIFAGRYLFNNPQLSVYPMWEQHIRAYPCIFLPLIFMFIKLTDNFKNPDKYKNLICIVLLCGIMQSAHQIVDTYYWDKNVKYMKAELKKVNEPLFIPSEHEIIGDFHTDTLRRFLWHGVYPATSILFSDEYKVKPLLLSYDTMQDNGNPEGREYLYLTEDKKLSIPFGAKLTLKNRYWDLTDCAYALDKYNKQNNIQTFGDE